MVECISIVTKGISYNLLLINIIFIRMYSYSLWRLGVENVYGWMRQSTDYTINNLYMTIHGILTIDGTPT